jgi:formylglycine-generating enzyme required for sulfatase activity
MEPAQVSSPFPLLSPTFLANPLPIAHLPNMLGTLAVLSSLSLAQVDPASGIDFVTVGAVGNAAYSGPGNRVNGRGRVDYEYRIGKYEVTTSQWIEFMNAAFDRPADDLLPHVVSPLRWGATGATPQNPGARRWSVVPGQEMFAVGGVDWRTSAMYCNWLHNGKSLDRDAFLSGAYEVSTFGYISDGGGFTDQLTRSPGARYFIPSLDEWIKAAHYDPNKMNNDGTLGGWWTYSNGSDTPFAYGPPGQTVRITPPLGPDPNGPLASANAGWLGQFPGFNPFQIPLGSYNATSSWGLYDVAGFTTEWMEGFIQLSGEPVPRFRLLDGSYWSSGGIGGDELSSVGSDFPTYSGSDVGFRIAAIVPSPGVGSLGVGVAILSLIRRRSTCKSQQQM